MKINRRLKTELKDSEIDWIGNIPLEWKTKALGKVFNENLLLNADIAEKNVLSLSRKNN
jgi:predicted metal-dependent TIM-barrel fold hydrolase